jgi:hypothetical protein
VSRLGGHSIVAPVSPDELPAAQWPSRLAKIRAPWCILADPAFEVSSAGVARAVERLAGAAACAASCSRLGDPALAFDLSGWTHERLLVAPDEGVVAVVRTAALRGLAAVCSPRAPLLDLLLRLAEQSEIRVNPAPLANLRATSAASFGQRWLSDGEGRREAIEAALERRGLAQALAATTFLQERFTLMRNPPNEAR